MESTINGIAARPESRTDPALQNSDKSATLKLWLLWLAVSLPLLWGVMKALEDVPYLFQ
jgi:hypothetical protein